MTFYYIHQEGFIKFGDSDADRRPDTYKSHNPLFDANNFVALSMHGNAQPQHKLGTFMRKSIVKIIDHDDDLLVDGVEVEEHENGTEWFSANEEFIDTVTRCFPGGTVKKEDITKFFNELIEPSKNIVAAYDTSKKLIVLGTRPAPAAPQPNLYVAAPMPTFAEVSARQNK